MILLEMLSYPFLVRAFLVGVLVSLCAALLGTSLVLKRYSMIGDGLSHVGFGALAIASALGVAPLAVAVPVVVPVRVAVVAIAASSLPVAVEIDHVVVMVLMGRIEHHVEVAHVQARLHHSRDVNGKPLHTQAFERRAHHLFPRTDVQQSRRTHVAADARSAFQIQKPGHVSSFASSNG